MYFKHQSLGDDPTDSPVTRFITGLFTSSEEGTPVVYGDETFGPPAPAVYYGPPAPSTVTPVKPATSTKTKTKAIPVAPSIPGSPSMASGNMLNWIIGGGVVVMGGIAVWLFWPQISQASKR